MNPNPEDIARIALVGVLATALLDLWLLLQARLGVPGLPFALLGRWVGHLARGTWSHPAIARAAPVRGERALGWLVHYAIGIGYAGLLAALAGTGWMRSPTLVPALAFGLATVAAPFFLMQPAMGAGIAAARTPAPARNRLESLANNAVFGLGLYLAAAGLERVLR